MNHIWELPAPGMVIVPLKVAQVLAELTNKTEDQPYALVQYHLIALNLQRPQKLGFGEQPTVMSCMLTVKKDDSHFP